MLCKNHVHIRDLQTSTKWTSRLQSKQFAQSGLQDSRLRTGQSQGRTSPRSQAVGTRQEATSEAKDYLITEVNKVDVGREATAFVFTALLLEGEPEVQCPTSHTTSQLVLPHLVPSYHQTSASPGHHVL